MKRPIVFISYSWDSQEHQDWVLKLAKDLIEKYSIDVLLDQYEISAGNDLTYFMESSIEKSDKVLLILTPNYKLKAEGREGGVGYETSMISQELFESPITKVKFIPILRTGDFKLSAPKFIKSKIYHSMTNETEYFTQLYELGRLLHNKPKIEKPKLGKIPDFESTSNDPIIDIANALTDEESINKELDRIIDSREGVEIANIEKSELFSNLKKRTDVYKNSTSLHFNFETDNRDNAVIGCNQYSVSFHLYNNVINTSTNTTLTVRFWKGAYRINGYKTMYFPGDEPKILMTSEYNFDLDLNKKPVWKFKNERFTKDEISNKSFAFIIESIRKEKTKGFRR